MITEMSWMQARQQQEVMNNDADDDYKDSDHGPAAATWKVSLYRHKADEMGGLAGTESNLPSDYMHVQFIILAWWKSILITILRSRA